MMFWNRPSVVSRTPILTTLLLEGGAVGQIVRMWTVRSAEGQSLLSWVGVTFALILWANFYRVVTPDAKWARYSAAFGVAVNAGICLTIIYMRYVQ